MELTYWEKQLILYSKLHFPRSGDLDDVKLMVAKEYGLPLKYVDNQTLSDFLFGLHEKLVENDFIRFDLENFIVVMFHMRSMLSHKDVVTIADVLFEIIDQIRSIPVNDPEHQKVINLGKPDQNLFNVISNKIDEQKEGAFIGTTRLKE